MNMKRDNSNRATFIIYTMKIMEYKDNYERHTGKQLIVLGNYSVTDTMTPLVTSQVTTTPTK